MYKFETQKEGVDFLDKLGYCVGRHGLDHIYTAEPPGISRDIASVATNGEMCLVDKGKPELKKYHDKIEIALNGRFVN